MTNDRSLIKLILVLMEKQGISEFTLTNEDMTNFPSGGIETMYNPSDMSVTVRRTK